MSLGREAMEQAYSEYVKQQTDYILSEGEIFCAGYKAAQKVGVGVSDEAVEAAEQAMRGHDCNEIVNRNIPHLARTALEAAAPLMGATPQPTLDDTTELRKATEALADFVEEIYEGCEPSRGCTGCEVLLKVRDVRTLLAAHPVRPLPTREQTPTEDELAVRISDPGAFLPRGEGESIARWSARAVAALLDGTERSPATNLDRAEEPK